MKWSSQQSTAAGLRWKDIPSLKDSEIIPLAFLPTAYKYTTSWPTVGHCSPFCILWMGSLSADTSTTGCLYPSLTPVGTNLSPPSPTPWLRCSRTSRRRGTTRCCCWGWWSTRSMTRADSRSAWMAASAGRCVRSEANGVATTLTAGSVFYPLDSIIYINATFITCMTHCSRHMPRVAWFRCPSLRLVGAHSVSEP